MKTTSHVNVFVPLKRALNYTSGFCPRHGELVRPQRQLGLLASHDDDDDDDIDDVVVVVVVATLKNILAKVFTFF